MSVAGDRATEAANSEAPDTALAYRPNPHVKLQDDVLMSRDPRAFDQRPAAAADSYIWGSLDLPLRHGSVVTGGRLPCPDPGADHL